MATAPLEITPRVNHITRQIIAAAMKVHTALGPGLLESAYHACLLHELRKQGLAVASQVGLPVIYDGQKLELGYRIDLIVNDLVIVEVKCVEGINPVHQAQLLSYMRLSGRQIGLLINFNVATCGTASSAWLTGTTGESHLPQRSQSSTEKSLRMPLDFLCVTLCPLWLSFLGFFH